MQIRASWAMPHEASTHSTEVKRLLSEGQVKSSAAVNSSGNFIRDETVGSL